jgi:anti-anti-sigma factor
MNFSISHERNVAVVSVGEQRLTYPLLAEFAAAVSGLITGGDSRIVIDLAPVGYVDSATIGCLMDLYRQVAAVGGSLKLAGLQKRVETMLTMTGAHNFLEVHPTRAAALTSFGG